MCLWVFLCMWWGMGRVATDFMSWLFLLILSKVWLIFQDSLKVTVAFFTLFSFSRLTTAISYLQICLASWCTKVHLPPSFSDFNFPSADFTLSFSSPFGILVFVWSILFSIHWQSMLCCKWRIFISRHKLTFPLNLLLMNKIFSLLF